MDNVILSPHIAGFSARYHEKASQIFIDNLVRYLEKRPLLNRFEHTRGY
jgi:phosphoglycerate dehydrogenase-like enzyme